MSHPNFKWWNLAACRDRDTELFFRDDDWSNIEARSVCDDCPAHRACLDESLEQAMGLAPGEDFGIRAGLDPAQRVELVNLIRELDCPGTVVQHTEDAA